MKTHKNHPIGKIRKRKTSYLLFFLSTCVLMMSSIGVAQTSPQAALDGLCPVCLVEMGKNVQGDPAYSVEKDGRIYLFPGEDQKAMFQKNPEKYIPAARGDCAVCEVEMRQKVAGDPRFFSSFDERLFLFPSEKQKQMFDANPEKYREAALALDGLCPVCLAGGKKVEGKREFQTWYDGMLYRFPSKEVKQTFIENPEKYVPVADGSCVVCQVEMDKEIPGSAQSSLIVDDRIYLFAGRDQMEMFRKNPSKYMSSHRRAPAGSGSSTPKKAPVQKKKAGSRSNR